jgi:hypothetical protein
MRLVTRSLAIIAAVAIVAAAGSSHAAKKVQERQGQVSRTFVNAAGEVAYGLHVEFSHKAVVVTDDANAAGPFRDLRGNDTLRLDMSNPSEPIAIDAEVELVFRSYSAGLKIKSWWWTNTKGKRVGKKQKG